MNWYIGQPIVAIANHSQGMFKKGDEFVINALRKKDCGCKDLFIDIGHREGYIGNVRCHLCNRIAESGTNINWYTEICFAPLDTDISELTEILTQTQLA